MTPGFKPLKELLKEIFYKKKKKKKKEIIEFLSHCCLLVFSTIKITKVTMFLKKGLGGFRCDNAFKQKVKFKINFLE